MTGQRSTILTAVLLISLGLNAYFIWSYHSSVPDVDFFHQDLHNAYFIKRHVGGKVFEIEHAHHLYTVRCEGTLSWPDGIYAPGQPMNDNCTYIPSMVGKSIAAGLMRNEGGALVYQPWENTDTIQTADVLKIINDAPD